MYVSVLVSFCWPAFCRLFHIFDLFFLFFNVLDSFPCRFLDIYFKKSSEFNDESKEVEHPNQHIMADDFRILQLVTLAWAALHAAARGQCMSTFKKTSS